RHHRQLYRNRYRNEWFAHALRFYPRHRIRLLHIRQPIIDESAAGDIRKQPDHRYESERVHWNHKSLSSSLIDVRSEDIVYQLLSYSDIRRPGHIDTQREGIAQDAY